MKFIHEDPEFETLLAVVAKADRLGTAMVEKDYWITHTLWALENAGLDVWFKGGTSLSKGFGIIQRFSEDLDLMIGPGTSGLPGVTKWKSGGKTCVEERRLFFSALSRLSLQGLSLELDETSMGDEARNANLRVDYPGIHLGGLPRAISPYILLEVGDARVNPSLLRPISSFLHDYLDSRGMANAYDANRPGRVNCVHPQVTLLEKLDAVAHRFPKQDVRAAAFVRHYEDAAHIILKVNGLPPMEGYESLLVLAREMLGQRQIRRHLSSDEECFNPSNTRRWDDLRMAHTEIQRIFWGPRLPFEEATEVIRTFLSGLRLT